MKTLLDNILLFVLVVRVGLARLLAPAGYDVYEDQHVSALGQISQAILRTMDRERHERLRAKAGLPPKQKLRAPMAKRLRTLTSMLQQHVETTRAYPTSYPRYRQLRTASRWAQAGHQTGKTAVLPPSAA